MQRKLEMQKKMKRKKQVRLKKLDQDDAGGTKSVTFDSSGKAILIKRPNIDLLNKNPHTTLCTPWPPAVNLRFPAKVQPTEISEFYA